MTSNREWFICPGCRSIDDCDCNMIKTKLVAAEDLEHQLRCPLHGKYQYFRKTIHGGHICNHQEPSIYPAEEKPICGMKAEMDVPWKEKQ